MFIGEELISWLKKGYNKNNEAKWISSLVNLVDVTILSVKVRPI